MKAEIDSKQEETRKHAVFLRTLSLIRFIDMLLYFGNGADQLVGIYSTRTWNYNIF